MDSYNLYDIKACTRALAIVEAMSTPVPRKAGHRSKVEDLRRALKNFCMPLNMYIFDPEFNNAFVTYNKAVNLYFETRTKAELDQLFKQTIRGMRKDLLDCINLERMTQSGELVPRPTITGYWIEPKR